MVSPGVTRRERRHGRLADTQERLREAHEIAGVASWEWRPESDEVVIFRALPDDAILSGTHASLDELLGPMSADERPRARVISQRLCAVIVRSPGAINVNTRTGRCGRRRPVQDLHGPLMCVRGTFQEVTEQQLAMQVFGGSRDFFQGTLDSLTAHIAVLDERGDIIMTNRAWNAFALANDATATEIGANYLEVCDAAKDDQLASLAGAGLRAIIVGSRTDFRMEYPCHSPTVERWFVLRAARSEGPGEVRVVVAHADITTRHQPDVEVTTWEGTVVGLHQDGSHFIARVAITPERSQGGMPIGFLTTSSDIMDDVRLTVELDRTPAYAHSTLESVPDAW